MKTITFNTIDHDDFIDFIKAYAIICVLFGHTFFWLDRIAYPIWAGMQVPLFIIIQAFHCYKKEQPQMDIIKALKRVLFPFIAVEALTIAIALLTSDQHGKALIISALTGGGYGAGTYYPWVYLQAALLLPLLSKWIRKSNNLHLILIAIVVSLGFEIFFSFINLPDWIYRLLVVRYLSLFCFGWIWVKNGIILNKATIFIAFISLFAILYFEYFSVDDEPWFFNTSWKTHRWPCYFYVVYGLVPILYLLWNKVKIKGGIVKAVKLISASTYEIFLIQMSVIVLCGYKDVLQIVDSPIVAYIAWVITIWFLSLCGGIYLHRKISALYSY